MEITPLGDSALIVRVVENFADDPDASLNAVLTALRCLENAAIPGVIELAPAYTTVALFYDPARIETNGSNRSPFDSLRKKIENVFADQSKGTDTSAPPPIVEIPVCYDAEFALDLDHVAAHIGLPATELIRRHANAPYRVACVGFIAGFPFLSGLPPELATPRRATPRKEIPAGSVAIGGAQAGVYPRKSPGGWNVIGRTPLRLFDVQRKPPPLLQAGDRVRFREISREEFDSLSR